jgi:hypothetical protein
MSQLRVVTDHLMGMAFPIPTGVSVIGRDPHAGMYLPDAEVSRSHATLERSGNRVILTDLGSTNGTWINTHPLHGSQELRPGDVIQLGQAQLVYDVNERTPADVRRSAAFSGGPAPGRRVGTGRVILIPVVVNVVGWATTAVLTFVAGRAVGVPGWLVGPTAAIVAGVVQSLFDAARGSAVVRADAGPAIARRSGGIPVAAAILTVLLIGVAGYAATVGIRYGVGWVTGNEDQIGGERLVAAQSGKSGRVTITVTGIVNTTHFTRVQLTVNNGEDQPATLALFRNCVLTGGAVTLQAEPFKSGWPEDVPPRSTQQGHITFAGQLPDSATTAQLSFIRVFVFGRFGVDDSVVVKSMRLRGP